MLPHQLADKGAPSDLRFRQGTPVFLARLRDMARAAKRLEVRLVPGIAASVERAGVVAFEPPRPTAPDTAPAVATEHGATGPRPSAGVQVDMVAAQVGLSGITQPRSGSGAGNFSGGEGSFACSFFAFLLSATTPNFSNFALRVCVATYHSENSSSIRSISA